MVLCFGSPDILHQHLFADTGPSLKNLPFGNFGNFDLLNDI